MVGERTDDAAEDKRGRGERAHPPLVEKLIAGFGLVLVLIAAGTMAYEAALETPAPPPDIVVEVVSVQPVSSGFLAEIRSVNRGGTTGAQVRIEGVLLDGSRQVETSSVTFTYVPNHSHQSGGLYFRNDPARHRLEVRATGYEEP